jgi:hypothetical protein
MGWGEDGYDYGTYDSPAETSPPAPVYEDNYPTSSSVKEDTATNTGFKTSPDLVEDTAKSNSSSGRDSSIADSSGVTGGNAGSEQKSNPSNGSNFLNDIMGSVVKGAVQGLMFPAGFGMGSGGGGQSTVNVISSGPATTTGNSVGNSLLNSSGGGNSGSGGTSGEKDNVLHNYVNYTYRLAIWAIPKETMNQIYNKQIKPGGGSAILNGGECVIADSGINEGNRSPDFPTDMGIDNLEIETITGAGGRTRGTDVISMKFDIIEPYTVALFARMRKLNNRLNGTKAGWNTMFFVMEISFWGYSDNGRPLGDKIPKTTRYIPFTFIDMKMKVSSTGATYSCKAIPTNSLGLTVLDNSIPFNVELQGTTIKDLFDATTASYAGQASGGGRDSNTTTTTGQTGGNSTGTTTNTITKGLKIALNASEKELTKPENKAATPGYENFYEFEFDSALGNAKISDPKDMKQQSMAMSSGKGEDQKKDWLAGRTGKLTVDLNKNVFKANAGTKITDLINSVLTVSDYMTKQYKPDGGDSSTPINMWKIIPTVKFGEIDPATNYYQRTIKFTIIPYAVKGQDDPNFGTQVPGQNEVVKSYYYIFTGKNKDVINVDLDYKMSFYEVRNGTPDNYVNKANDSPGSPEKPPAGPNKPNTTGGFKPRYHFARGLANRQNSGSTTESYASIGVQNLMEKVMDNAVDLLSLNIEINGDPAWISQDYSLYGNNVDTSPTLVDGSINLAKEAYFDFFFFSPTKDYDDSTGIFSLDGDYTDFSGRYKVISVKSKFASGKFTQNLKNIRLRNQANTNSGSARKDETPTNKQTQVAGGDSNPGGVIAVNPVKAPIAVLREDSIII